MRNLVLSCGTVFCILLSIQCEGDKELRMLTLLPMTGEAWPGGWSCLVPVQMAVDGINAHADLLQGYRLTFEYVDHEVRCFVKY